MRRELGILAVLVALTVAVFSRTLQADFVMWDDDINIYKNPHVQGLDAARLRWMFTDMTWVRYYAPLAWLSVALVHQCSGLNPLGYHLANVLLHCANVALVFLLLRKLLLAHQRAPLTDTRRTGLVLSCGLGALLWAVHPLRVEPVAWATGLSNCQALLFFLVAVLAYVQAVTAGSAGRLRFGYYALSLTAFALSLLTYPIGLALAAVLIVLDVFPLRRFGEGRGRFWNVTARRIWREKVPYVAISALALGFTVYRRMSLRGLSDVPVGLDEFGVLHRLMQAIYLWAYYAWKPWVPFELAPVYTQLLDFEPFAWPFVVSLVFVAGISILLFLKRRQWPLAAALWLIHLAVLVPVLGWTEHPYHANDRYSLIAGVLWPALLASGLFHLWERPAARRESLLAAGAGIALLGVFSFAQTGLWRNSETLFRGTLRTVGAHHSAFDIHWRYALWLAEQNRLEEAEIHYAESIRLEPNFPESYNGLGKLRARQGRWAEAGALYEKAHQISPNLASVYNNMVWLLATADDDRVRNGAEAVRLAELLTQANPTNAAFLQTLSAAYAETGRFTLAITAAEKARALAMTECQPELLPLIQELLGHYRAGRPYRSHKEATHGSSPNSTFQ